MSYVAAPYLSAVAPDGGVGADHAKRRCFAQRPAFFVSWERRNRCASAPGTPVDNPGIGPLRWIIQLHHGERELPWPGLKKNRIVACDPSISYFKPRGVPLRDMEEVRLTIDQMEALRLADLEGLSQEAAGREMGVSRATFGRIVQSARKVVAEALVQGKAILMEGGKLQLENKPNAGFECQSCGKLWEAPMDGCQPKTCPSCGQPNSRKIHCQQS